MWKARNRYGSYKADCSLVTGNGPNARSRYGSYKADCSLVTGNERAWPSYLRCNDGTIDVI